MIMNDLTIRALLLTIPLLTGLLWLWASRRDRRRTFIQKRLAAFTAGDAPVPHASILRVVTRSTSSILIDQIFTQAIRERLNAGFAATGNSIGYLHLLIASLIAAVIVSAF